MRVISSQFFSGTKEMTRARIMRVNSRQKRVNQIRASFVKDAWRKMRVDTRSLAGALKSTFLTFEKSCTSCPNWGEGGGGEVIWAMPERKHSFFQEVFPYSQT